MKSPLNISVSCFKNYNTPDNPRDVNLLSWLKSGKYRSKVEEIRQATDKKQRDRLKAELPAITPSGRFTRRAKDDLIDHSGFLQFDIDGNDHKHVVNFDELKFHICKLPEVAYCGLSVSGRGYWGLIPIANSDKHLQHFRALQKAFKRYGITIDASCSDVSRLRGYSWDPNGYFNHSARTFTKLDEQRTARSVKPSHAIKRTSYTNDTRSDVEQLIEQIQSQRVEITEGYENWRDIGFALESEFGESGRDYFHAISQYHPDYNEREADRQFDHCLRSNGQGVTIATFFHICKQYGLTVCTKSAVRPQRRTNTPKNGDKPSQAKISAKGYPSSFDDIERPAPGSPEDIESARATIADAESDELRALMKVDPVLRDIVEMFDCEIIQN